MSEAMVKSDMLVSDLRGWAGGRVSRSKGAETGFKEAGTRNEAGENGEGSRS